MHRSQATCQQKSHSEKKHDACLRLHQVLHQMSPSFLQSALSEARIGVVEVVAAFFSFAFHCRSHKRFDMQLVVLRFLELGASQEPLRRLLVAEFSMQLQENCHHALVLARLWRFLMSMCSRFSAAFCAASYLPLSV